MPSLPGTPTKSVSVLDIRGKKEGTCIGVSKRLTRKPGTYASKMVSFKLSWTAVSQQFNLAYTFFQEDWVMDDSVDLGLEEQILYLNARIEVISTVLEVICMDRVSNDASEDPVRTARKLKEDLLALVADRPDGRFIELCKEFSAKYMDDTIARAKSL